MSNLEEFEHDTFILEDADGTEGEYEVVEVVTVEGKSYALLAPIDAEETEEGVEAVVMRIEGDTLVGLESEEEFNRVIELFEALNVEEG